MLERGESKGGLGPLLVAAMATSPVWKRKQKHREASGSLMARNTMASLSKDPPVDPV